MKKILWLSSLLVVLGALTFGALQVQAANPVAENASMTSRIFRVTATKKYVQAKIVHTNKHKVAVNHGILAADRPWLQLTAKGQLTAHTNYRVSQTATVITQTKHHVSYSKVVGHGWVLSRSLAAGKISQ